MFGEYFFVVIVTASDSSNDYSSKQHSLSNSMNTRLSWLNVNSGALAFYKWFSVHQEHDMALINFT